MENQRRIDRLDEAFLFIISMVGVLFTIIQVYTKEIQGLVEISPLMFIGVFLPFYVGYVRGAIICNTIEERLRGWSYLAVGVSTYLALFLTKISPVMYWIFILISIILVFYIEKWFDSIFDVRKNISTIYAYFGTIIGGFCLAIVSRWLINLMLLNSNGQPFKTNGISTIVFSGIGVLIFIVYEKLSRQIIGINLPLKNDEKEVRQIISESAKNFLTYGLFLFPFELIFIAPEQDLRISFLSFQAFSFVFIGTFLMFKTPLFGAIFEIFGMFFAIMAFFLFMKIKKIDFSKISYVLQAFSKNEFK